METVLLIVHILVAIGLIALVLLQQGKGADAGAAFGSGASSTVFGAQGSATFLSRGTAVLATVFFVTSLSLAYFSGRASTGGSVVERTAPAEQQPVPSKEIPAAPSGQSKSTVPEAPGSSKKEQPAQSKDIPTLPPGQSKSTMPEAPGGSSK